MNFDRRSLPGHSSFLILLPLLAVAFPSAPARAQAVPTATRYSEINAFGEFEILHPDREQPSGSYFSNLDKGIVLGADYAHFFNFPVLPSFELRATYSGKGPIAGEETLLGGGRLELTRQPFGRVHPYANFLVGVGQINYTHPGMTANGLLTSDNSTVFNYGGGADVQVSTNFSVQAEFQYQNWNLGTSQHPDSFTPSSLNFGLRYRIPFKPRHKRP